MWLVSLASPCCVDAITSGVRSTKYEVKGRVACPTLPACQLAYPAYPDEQSSSRPCQHRPGRQTCIVAKVRI